MAEPLHGPLAQALTTGLFYGLVLSILIGGLFIGLGPRMPAEAILRGYPPEVRARIGPVGEGGHRARRMTALLLLPVLFGTLAAALFHLAVELGGDFGFLPATISVFVMLTVFSLFDLIVLDWLIFVRLRPRFVVLPGTGEAPRTTDFGFHLTGFVRGIIIALIASPAIGGIAAGVFAMAGPPAGSG